MSTRPAAGRRGKGSAVSGSAGSAKGKPAARGRMPSRFDRRKPSMLKTLFGLTDEIVMLGRRIDWLQAQLSDARAFWDAVHADTRKRVTALEGRRGRRASR